MIGYKLFRKRKDGTLGSLFINRKARLPVDQWMQAESHRTKGYAFRPHWHVLERPEAPHLTLKGRVWCRVEMSVAEGIKTIIRRASQGGVWYLAQRIRIIEEI